MVKITVKRLQGRKRARTVYNSVFSSSPRILAKLPSLIASWRGKGYRVRCVVTA